ncbi:MAG: transketolase [Bdellovibrionaceae bacterium]|nr:transketolase [Pseudobdellovibrionaceae bacterium]
MSEMFSSSLVEHVKKNSNIYLLSGDHGYALFDLLRKQLPSHFINAGVAEQNMVGVAAGMAKQGLYPIIYGLCSFVPVRVLEQIKIDLCYENLPCLIIGDGAGIVYSHLGSSHQSTGDIAVLRALPNISILSPCDKYELKACFDWALRQKSPIYMRLGKADLGEVYSQDVIIQAGKPILVQGSRSDIAFAVTGSMVKMAHRLNLDFTFKANIYSFPIIKTLDKLHIVDTFKKYKMVFVLEEHSVYGGLGSALSEIFAALSGSPQIHRIGIQDKFSVFCGSYDYLIKEHGLAITDIAKKINGILEH